MAITESNETDTAEYELSNNNNTVVFTRSNGIDNVYARVSINPDLVGTWSGIITDTGGSTAEQIYTLNSDGTGSVSNLWDDGEVWSSAVVWSSTSSTITFTITVDNETDLYVYLYQNTERLLDNIKKRGRDFEQDIEANYLHKINKGYM